MSKQAGGAAVIDQPKDVREGFDVAAVDAWVKGHVDGLSGEPAVKQYPGGASNLTYLLSYPERDLILRRPPPGTKAKSAHDMGREYRVLSALQGVMATAPEPLAFCDDPAILGDEFYVMERLVGTILRQEIPRELGLDEARTRSLCEGVVDQLIALHTLDYEAAGLGDLGRGAGYTRRQVEGWSRRYRKALTDDATDFERVMAWLDKNQPAEDVATVLIHNDFRFDNVVLAPDDPLRIIGVLDWEMCTLGDPLMDLGNSLAYWVQADDEMQFQFMRRQPTHAPGMMTRAEVVEYYAARTGWRVDDFTFYEVYGLFRLAVILQQIYYRYVHKQTTNPTFAGFGAAAQYLEQRCLKRIG